MAWLILLLALVAMPLAEIAVFIEVGGCLGLWPTLALIVLTAVLGTWIIRLQGLGLLRRAQEQLDRGVPPVSEVFSGLCLLVAGALLLTPGFITDTLGAILLVPPVRALLYRLVRERLTVYAVQRGGSGRHRGEPAGAGRARVIEGEFQEVEPAALADDDEEEEEPLPPPRGGWGRRGP